MIINSKQQSLDELAKLDDETLHRIASLSSNEKAIGFFKNPIQFLAVKTFLGIN